MDKKLYLPIALAIITAFIVFTPHYQYSFPLHIDEWHHITEAQRLDNGEYSGGSIGYRIGFHILLLAISKVIPLIEFYKFLPAIWMALTSLILFYVVSKKFNYTTAIFSMIFFASLKSNVNLLGPWFFVPLTFSFPFILLFMYFFDQGIQEFREGREGAGGRAKKQILLSLAIMLFLIPIHSISVLFAIPILLIYSFFHKDYIIKEWKFFSSFLVIPVLGVIFFSFINNLSITQSLTTIIQQLQFHKGWGVLELNNSPLETFSLIGYILAIIGFSSLYKSNKKKYSLFLIWPIILLISILIFKLTGTSYLSPYQRNFYYFSLVLPILSGAGLSSFINFAKSFSEKERIKSLISIFIIILTIFLIFQNYTSIPNQIEVYHVIENSDYETLLSIKDIPKSTVMAFPTTSVALYPLTLHKPVATLAFYGNRDDAQKFYLSESCKEKTSILKKHNATIIITKIPNLCDYKLIKTSGEDFIYQVK